MDIALLRGYMSMYFGWRLNVTNNTRPAGLRNFPMQAHGAEMLRIACCLATERGVRVCAPGPRRAANRGADLADR